MNFSIDIIIPTYNRQDLLRKTLDSILNQTLLPLRIIIIDSSVDDSIRALIYSYKSKFNALEIIVDLHRQNRSGVSAARNLGITLSSSDYLFFLDSDDILKPSYVAEFRAYYSNSDTRDTIAYTSFKLIDEFSKPVEDIISPLFSYHSGDIYHKLLSNNYFLRNIAQVVFPRAIFTKGFRFDESLLSSEDWDILVRVAKIYRFHFLDKKLLFFRRHPLNTGNDKYYVFINNFKFYKKWISLNTPRIITEMWGRQIVYQIVMRLPSLDFYKRTKQLMLEDTKCKKALFPRFFGNLFLNIVYSVIVHQIYSIGNGKIFTNIKIFVMQRKKYLPIRAE